MFDLIVTFSSSKSITYQNTIINLHILDHDYYFKLLDLFLDQDTPEKMYEKAGLNFNSIVEKIEEALKSNIIFAKNKNKFSN